MLLRHIMEVKIRIKIINIYKTFLTIITILSSTICFAMDIDITTVGKSLLALPGGIEISIVNFDKYEEDGHLNWKAKLIVKHKSKVIIEKYPIMTNYDENHFYYFVPIKNMY